MLYLHIPFCKQACSYCNFHFSTNLKPRKEMIDAICKELRLRRKELPPGPVETIYLGGGTPSLLTGQELDQLFSTLRAEGYWDGPQEMGEGYHLAVSAEITLEANPDDLTPERIATLARSPVNRLSVGIQSFNEADLRFMNRAHDSEEARTAVEKVVAAGFDDISIDLIYGGQTTTDAIWADNLRRATDLGVSHVSSYALTVEPKTALGHLVEHGKVADTDDERFATQFDMLVDHLTAYGYDHYEISNFALPGRESRHNSGYWSGRPYLGVGPGAHSFDGKLTRRWNVSSNAKYLKALAEIGTPEELAAAKDFLFEREVLTPTDAYNEFIMTGLRRSIGVKPSVLAERFSPELAAYFVDNQRGNLERGLFHPIQPEDPVYRLTRAGIRLADGVIGDGFFVGTDS